MSKIFGLTAWHGLPVSSVDRAIRLDREGWIMERVYRALPILIMVVAFAVAMITV